MATERLMKRNRTLELNKIPSKLLTLGEMMHHSGFTTLGVADNLNIDGDIGFTSGFEHFHTFQYEGAPKVVETVMSLAPKMTAPYFLYIHFMDPHGPYHKREPWFDEAHPNPTIAAYNSEIRYADEHIKQLFERFSWLQDSLVLVFADHGEEFGEHGGRGHGRTLYPEVIRVPLLIYHRSIAPKRVVEPAHLTDILPTIADAVGFQPLPFWEGQSLLGVARGLESLDPARKVFSELLRRPEEQKPGVRSAFKLDWLFIRQENETEGDDRMELFFLPGDRYAQTNLDDGDLTPEEQSRKDEFRSALESFVDRKVDIEKEAVDIEMDKETIESLKALGYL
jgi:arylsulfatase A-like enzyme